MPKEHVTDPRTQTRIVVGWERDRDMSIAVTTPAEQSVFWRLLAGSDDAPAAVDHGRVIFLAQVVAAAIEMYPIPSVDHCVDCDVTLCPRHDRERQEAYDARGTAILNALDTAAGSVILGSLWFPMEDRRQVNHLIRLVRRARDAAFGKDE